MHRSIKSLNCLSEEPNTCAKVFEPGRWYRLPLLLAGIFGLPWTSSNRQVSIIGFSQYGPSHTEEMLTT